MRHLTYQSLHQFTAFPTLFPINAYVYEEEKYLTVIDVGLNIFVKHIQRLVVKLDKPIKYIILTHPHTDHIAGLDLLKQKFPDARVIFSIRDQRLLIGDFSLDADECQAKIRGGFKSISTKPDYLTQDGDIIGNLTVIATPGHTPGSISLYDSKQKILIVGDALQTKGGLAIAGDKRKIFPFPALATWSEIIALESTKKIAKLPINCLATGHGKLLIQPDFKKVIDRLEKKILEEKN